MVEKSQVEEYFQKIINSWKQMIYKETEFRELKCNICEKQIESWNIQKHTVTCKEKWESYANIKSCEQKILELCQHFQQLIEG